MLGRRVLLPEHVDALAQHGIVTLADLKSKADDASLECPEGVFTSDQIKDIDMSKWMAKSKAWLIVEPDKRILLDDYKFKNMHVIVGYFASRFHPDDWTGEAKPIKQEEAAEPGGEDAESPSSAPD